MWYNKVVADLGNIPAFINYYEDELVEAKQDCGVRGNLEKNIAGLPGLTEHRFNQLQEIEAAALIEGVFSEWQLECNPVPAAEDH